jgi:hypothetical protein
MGKKKVLNGQRSDKRKGNACVALTPLTVQQFLRACRPFTVDRSPLTDNVSFVPTTLQFARLTVLDESRGGRGQSVNL